MKLPEDAMVGVVTSSLQVVKMVNEVATRCNGWCCCK